MKKKILTIILLVLTAFLFASCQSGVKSKGGLSIQGETKLELGFTYEYSAKLNGKELNNNDVYWMVNNDNVQLINNVLIPLSEGSAKLTAILKEDGSKYCILEVEVIAALVNSIELYSNTKEIKVGNQCVINFRTNPSDVTEEVFWSTSDSSIATVDSGIVTGVGAGEVEINARCGSAKASYKLTVVKEITEIEMYSDNNIKVNSTTALSFNIDDAIITSKSSRVIVEDKYLYAVEKGNATIHVESKSNPNLKRDFTFEISDGVIGLEMTEDEELQIKSLMSEMSPEQKVGQLFMLNIAANGLVVDDEGLYYQGRYGDNNRYYIAEALSGRSIGNLYISAQNLVKSNRNTIDNVKCLIQGYQSYILAQANIGALVVGDASGEYYYPFTTNYFSNYLTNLELGTISNYSSSATNFSVMSNEMAKLGINVLIYNAYTESTVSSGTFSNVLEKQCINSKILQTALSDNNIILTPYFGTYMANESNGGLDYNTKLIKSAINSGIGIIDIYYSDYFKNMNGQSIPDYLKSLGYKGLIIDSNTQGLNEDDYKTSYYNSIMSGVDMLYMQYSSNSWNNYNKRSLAAYDYLVERAEDDSETALKQRIDEAVTKVLLQKIRTDSLKGSYPTEAFGTNGDNQSQINSLVKDNNTYYIEGDYKGLDKSVKTYAFSSPYVKYFYNSQSDQYNFCATMLLNATKNGYSQVAICNFDSTYMDKINTITSTDQVVITMYDNINLYYTIKDEEGNEQSVSTSWVEVLDKIQEKTSNIVLVFMNDPALAKNFEGYNYTKIYANYNYDYNFTSLINILGGGQATGKKLNEK